MGSTIFAFEPSHCRLLQSRQCPPLARKACARAELARRDEKSGGVTFQMSGEHSIHVETVGLAHIQTAVVLIVGWVLSLEAQRIVNTGEVQTIGPPQACIGCNRHSCDDHGRQMQAPGAG